MLLALAACASPPQQPQVAFNPPPQAMGARDADTRWYHVSFPSAGTRIAPDQRGTIATVADAMRNNQGLRATVIGRADTVGADQANLRLSRARANAVRDALVRDGRVPAQRIDVRWTGDRRQSAVDVPVRSGADDRVVDIGLR
jgi:OOP family OmpA-OmpF porin